MAKKTKKVSNKWLGKKFNYKGGVVEAKENLGVCYEDDTSVYYDCVVVKPTKDNKKGSKIVLRYQTLRLLKLAEVTAVTKKTTKKKAS